MQNLIGVLSLIFSVSLAVVVLLKYSRFKLKVERGKARAERVNTLKFLRALSDLFTESEASKLIEEVIFHYTSAQTEDEAKKEVMRSISTKMSSVIEEIKQVLNAAMENYRLDQSLTALKLNLKLTLISSGSLAGISLVLTLRGFPSAGLSEDFAYGLMLADGIVTLAFAVQFLRLLRRVEGYLRET